MANLDKVHAMIKERDVKYVALRFTDTRGKMQVLSQHVCTMDNEAWEKGIFFDGTSTRAPVRGLRPVRDRLSRV